MELYENYGFNIATEKKPVLNTDEELIET